MEYVTLASFDNIADNVSNHTSITDKPLIKRIYKYLLDHTNQFNLHVFDKIVLLEKDKDSKMLYVASYLNFGDRGYNSSLIINLETVRQSLRRDFAWTMSDIAIYTGICLFVAAKCHKTLKYLGSNIPKLYIRIN